MAACLGIAVDIIGPAGFDLTDRALRRAGLDYLDKVDISHHISFNEFRNGVLNMQDRRLILLTTHGDTPYWNFDYHMNDILLFGRESAGVPKTVHSLADARLVIPMQQGLRSLNVAVAAAMVVGEALRQLRGKD